jgi:hypothetical protein
MTDGSSNWPAGVRRSPPSGLNERRRKKFVKLSSPYSFADVDAHATAEDGRLRIAGSGGMGDGERPYRTNVDGEPGALEPLKDERRDDGLSMGGGGNIADEELATDVAGVKGVISLPCADTDVSSFSFG